MPCVRRSQRKSIAAWLPLVSFAVMLAPASALAAETVAIAAIAGEYIGGGLEFAVVPQPQEAKLTDRMLVIQSLEVKTAKATSPFTQAQAHAWVESLERSRKESSIKNASSPLLLGELGDGGEADQL